MISWAKHALDVVYPAKCGLCDLLGEEPICSICLASFERFEQPIHEAYGTSTLDRWADVFRYEDRAGQAVRDLKYSRSTWIAGPMAQMLAEAAQELGLLEVDLIIPVPIHWTRFCTRGFNQAELLCEQLPREMVRRGLLFRTRATRPQVGLDPEIRTQNLRGAFMALPEVKGRRVLLVDDVLTTGHTARECASALKRAGAAEVWALAFAGG